MKRRDLLKTGTMMLAAPAVRASALLKSNSARAVQGQGKNLVVVFSGAFCFWQDGDRFKVMVPPVGKESKDPHMPWVGTTANSKALQGFPNFTLSVGGFSSSSGMVLPPFTGTRYFSYEQGPGSGALPLFNFFAPMPTQIIGIRPTGAKMICKPGTQDPYCTEYMIYASGLSFLYQNVDLDRVLITAESDKDVFYKPCFINDASLAEATVTVHLTPLTRVEDPGHGHARYVWKQMVSMYPWMQEEIHDIDFCRDFDPSTCPASCPPTQPGNSVKGHEEAPSRLLINPSNDCQAPIMILPIGVNRRK